MHIEKHPHTAYPISALADPLNCRMSVVYSGHNPRWALQYDMSLSTNTERERELWLGGCLHVLCMNWKKNVLFFLSQLLVTGPMLLPQGYLLPQIQLWTVWFQRGIQIWTWNLLICSQMLYHWAVAPSLRERERQFSPYSASVMCVKQWAPSFPLSVKFKFRLLYWHEIQFV